MAKATIETKQTTKNKKEEKVMEQQQNGRVSVGAGEVQNPAERRATRRLGVVARTFNNPFWYREREGELALVTDEPVNYALGIRRIMVFEPSEAQWNAGVIANVRLELGTEDVVFATISGMQIRESKQLDGSIYLSTPSRNIAKEGEQARWLSDITLSNAVKAQILSYVETLLVDVE